MQVLVSENILDPSSWEVWEDVDDIREFFLENYKDGFPKNARLYLDHVAKDRDVTPTTPEEFENLNRYTGNFHLVRYPMDPTGGILTFIVVGIAAVAAIAFLIRPPAVAINSSGNVAKSPNNELSSRTNSARINGKIPDILGRVRSTPDLIAGSYSIFENNTELELSYMCVGVGEYLVEDVRDDSTPINSIADASYEFYGPNTSPNYGAPFLTHGTITQPLASAKRISSVNGQVLRPPNSNSYTGKNNIYFKYPNEVHVNDSEKDMTELFDSGDSITISNSSFSGESAPARADAIPMIFNAAGTISVSSVDLTTLYQVGDTITISNALFAFDPSVSISVTTGTVSGSGTASSAADASTSVSASTTTTITKTLAGKVTVGGVDYTVDFTGTNITANSSTTATATTSVTVNTTLGTISTPGVPTGFSATSSGSNVINLEGTYVISALTSTLMTLTSPSSVNPDWTKVSLFADSSTPSRTVKVDRAQRTVSGDLNGTYTVSSVSSGVIILSSASSVNTTWNLLNGLVSSSTGSLSPFISSSYDKWTSAFVVQSCDHIYANVVAMGGLFKDNGTQYALSVSVTMECTPVDSSGAPTGSAQTFNTTINGSSTEKTSLGSTIMADLGTMSRWSVRFKRNTQTDNQFDGTVQDEIKVRDLYAIELITQNDFGDVTTVYTKTYATAGALAVKERKFNCLVTRKIPNRISGTTFSANTATRRVDDILVFAITSSSMGRRQLSEINLDEIYDTVQEIEDYFGTSEAVSFGHTFDNDNNTFEEILATIAKSCFSTMYRSGNTIGMRFEKLTNNSVAIFNHRNKLPGSEKRTVRFTPQDDYDGVEIEYFDSLEGTSKIYAVPASGYSNPSKVTLLGVQSEVVAHLHAWRIYNKILYQNTYTEFDALEEAALVISNDRVLVADNTRPDTQDGEVIGSDGLMLTLSQPVSVLPSKTYSIFLWLADGTVESIPIIATDGSYDITLSSPPSIPVVHTDSSVKTIYQIVSSTEVNLRTFLIAEKETNGDNGYSIKALSYDDVFYSHDADHKESLI